jgi:outer membrane protein TolC
VKELTASPESKLQPASYGYFDFPTCVRYSLVHSEALIKNRMEIQIQSADLKDAHAEIIPYFEVNTRYYLARTRNYNADPSSATRSKFSTSLVMANFNPLVALVKIKAKSTMVDVATTTHEYKITENIANMAKLFFRISFLEKNLRTDKQIAAFYRNKVQYAKSRSEQGDFEPLTLRAWNNSLRGQDIKIKTLEHALDQGIGQLKLLMGYHPDYHLPLDTRDAANQILLGFNGRVVTFADVQASNLGLKIVAKREQLQSVLVAGAYLLLLPRPVFIFQDLNNQVDSVSGTTVAIGTDYTLWDGFKRVRDIKRQKLRAGQINIERQELSRQLYERFKTLRGDISLSEEKEGFSREQTKLAESNEERAFSQYKSGSLTYDIYLDTSIAKAQSHLNSLNTVQERVSALIDLATIAGGLNKYNAGIRY